MGRRLDNLETFIIDATLLLVLLLGLSVAVFGALHVLVGLGVLVVDGLVIRIRMVSPAEVV